MANGHALCTIPDLSGVRYCSIYKSYDKLRINAGIELEEALCVHLLPQVVDGTENLRGIGGYVTMDSDSISLNLGVPLNSMSCTLKLIELTGAGSNSVW